MALVDLLDDVQLCYQFVTYKVTRLVSHSTTLGWRGRTVMGEKVPDVVGDLQIP